MFEKFSFQFDNRLLYGVGRSMELGTFIKDRGFADVMILVDEGVVAHSSYYGQVVPTLQAVAKVVEVRLRGSEEPDYDYLDEIAAKARSMKRPDLILGIGGGSAMDITKAVAVLLTNPGCGLDYRGFDKVLNPGVPVMLIPTTAGTGSEVTINAVFTDKQEMRKLGINGRYMNASWALLDAEWTTSCPKSAALSAGMDAMVHSLESFMCRQHNGLTRVFSREAFRLLYENLPCLIDDAANLERRQKILLGAYLAGAALFNSGSGISGAFSYPLGVNFKIPHGICGAIFLPSVIEYNVQRGYEDYAELYDLIHSGSGMSSLQKSQQFAIKFKEFSERIGVPKHLDQWNVNNSNVQDVAKMLLPLQAAFDQNPVDFSAMKDAPQLLQRHIA